MNAVAHHRMPMSTLTALARGDGGANTIRLLRVARRSRTLLLIRMIVENNPHIEPAYQALVDIQRVAPRAVAEVLDYPTVGAWAVRAARSAADAGQLALIAAAAAISARVNVDVPITSPRISLPSLGTALFESEGSELGVRCRVNQTELRRGKQTIVIPGPLWLPRQHISPTDGIRFLLDYWAGQNLPADLRSRVTHAHVRRWQRRVRSTWHLLNRHHTALSWEIACCVSVLTPLAASPIGHTSATLADAFGCVFLSLPAEPRSLALVLAHEIQHAKLAVVMDLFPLTVPAGKEGQHYAPWRTDPRPIVGLLHGTYAFLGVTSFWRRQRFVERTSASAEHAHTEFARWRHATRQVAHYLLKGHFLTSVGRSFVTEIADTLDKWSREPVPPTAARTAARMLHEHRARFDQNARLFG